MTSPAATSAFATAALGERSSTCSSLRAASTLREPRGGTRGRRRRVLRLALNFPPVTTHAQLPPYAVPPKRRGASVPEHNDGARHVRRSDVKHSRGAWRDKIVV